MPWFKVDDQLPLSPKFVDLPMSAIGLWTMAGAWCSQHLTDGLLSRRLIARLGGDEDAATELVKAGLWHTEPDGYRFHDWHDYQPRRDEVLAEREAARQRMKALRQRRKGLKTAQPSTGDLHDDPQDDPQASEEEHLEDQAPHDQLADQLADERGQNSEDAGNGDQPPAADATTEGPDQLEDLRTRLDDIGLQVSWRGVEGDRQEIEQLLAKHHGPAALVAVAKRMANPGNPARSYRAWLEDWRLLRPRPPGKAAATTTAGQCPVHPGEPLARCSQCNRPGTPMPPDVRKNLRRRHERPDDHDRHAEPHDGQDEPAQVSDDSAALTPAGAHGGER